MVPSAVTKKKSNQHWLHFQKKRVFSIKDFNSGSSIVCRAIPVADAVIGDIVFLFFLEQPTKGV